MPKANAQPEEASIVDDPSIGTRDRLLAAASTAIAQSGWSAVTTRQVAGLAGVNQGVVHYHFGSMDALRREAALVALGRELEGPTAALVEGDSLADGIRACLEAVEAIDPRSESSTLLYEAMLAAARDDDLRSILRVALAEFRGLLARRARDEGAADPDAAATVVAAALDGVLLHRLVDPGLDLSRMAAPLVAALELPKKPRPRRSP